MAIKPGYKTFTFDGQSSGAYKTYITGSAVYNAPEREVEMIEIPGRNGAFALDKGRFENIEVTYPAGIYAESQEDFAAALSDLRNMLCSRRGYCRLEDEYNPDEYRMAVYKSGLDVDPAAFQRAGEFEITFDCKPQRWLTSGETKQTIANSGDSITNPTLFEASPMLEVEGYGDINVNDITINVSDGVYGEVVVYDPFTPAEAERISLTMNLKNLTLFNLGDMFTIGFREAFLVTDWIRYTSCKSVARYNIVTTPSNTSLSASFYGREITLNMRINPIEFQYGTPQTITLEAIWEVVYNIQGTGVVYEQTKQYTTSLSFNYDGNDKIVCLFVSGAYNLTAVYTGKVKITLEAIGYSTKTSLMSPLYIDFDIGEAYGIKNGTVISQNNIVTLPSDFKLLKQGSNTITFDNTITDLKVVPRWWKV